MSSASVSNVDETTVVVRRAMDRDLAFVRDLCRGLFLAYGSYHEYVEGWFRERTVSTWIAEIDEESHGFVMFTLPEDGSVSELVAIGVSSAVQSRGVGKALLAKCFEVLLQSSGVREVHLQVAEGNARAQRMFARSGFRVRPETGIYPAGQRALFMTKTLKREGAR